MIVKSFKYDDYLWKLDTIYLDKLNLIVGKNAVGKSKTLRAMAYVATVEGAKTFLVDDLGEGLDYSRSSKLSKIMFDYCEAHDIQLIVTSNDNFLMNAISLDNWIILRRNGKNVTGYSRYTHPDMFVKFRKMGLNNFDMLSTDFIERFLSSAEQ